MEVKEIKKMVKKVKKASKEGLGLGEKTKEIPKNILQPNDDTSE